MSELLAPEEWLDFIARGSPLLDVRAPIEFQQGHVPGSVNLPILNDSEREKVGWTYKNQGQDKAIELGHQLVQGAIKEERLALWLKFLSQSENSVITCFRGGLRSRIVQAWCKEAGVDRPRVSGGYKALRQFLSDDFTRRLLEIPLTVLSGPTGAGKTFVLNKVRGRALLDLEASARHRGSAFGGYEGGQPSQAVFENQLAVDLIRADQKRSEALEPLLVEDESRMIGSCVQPEILFKQLRLSALIMIDESLDSRTELTFQEYVVETALSGSDEEQGLRVFESYLASLSRISSRLGGDRLSELHRDLSAARDAYLARRDLTLNRVWVRKLLDWYYDPLYRKSLARRDPRVLFQGTREEVQQFLESHQDWQAAIKQF